MRTMEIDCLLQIDVVAIAVVQRVLIFPKALKTGRTGGFIEDLVIICEAGIP